ncbi:MAG: type II toxin-antitoxin system PemK/MazF family toxin [Actinomycetota bacterium]
MAGSVVMKKWSDLGIKVVKQLKELQEERDPVSGRSQQRGRRRTERVESGITIDYTPDRDGEADPGEVVWAWVPYREDPNRGKDRPVVIVGRIGDDWAGVPLTSKNKGRADHVPVGSGGWDPQGRPSWAKVDRVLRLDDDDVRREGSVLARDRFDDVVGNLRRYHDVAS